MDQQIALNQTENPTTNGRVLDRDYFVLIIAVEIGWIPVEFFQALAMCKPDTGESNHFMAAPFWLGSLVSASLDGQKSFVFAGLCISVARKQMERVVSRPSAPKPAANRL